MVVFLLLFCSCFVIEIIVLFASPIHDCIRHCDEVPDTKCYASQFMKYDRPHELLVSGSFEHCSQLVLSQSPLTLFTKSRDISVDLLILVPTLQCIVCRCQWCCQRSHKRDPTASSTPATHWIWAPTRLPR